MSPKTRKFALLALWAVAVFIVATIAYCTFIDAPGELEASEAPVLIMDREGDSLQVAVQWAAAPRAQTYRVRIGDNAGEWEREREVPTSPTTLWAVLMEEAQDAFVCVTAYNRHPTRGLQEGGTACSAWVVPASLAPPGTPGRPEILPDTATLEVASFPRNAEVTLTSLGQSAIDLSFGWIAMGDIYACVTMPDGREGLLESQVANGWELHTVPNPRFWELRDCQPNLEVLSDAVSVVWHPGQPVLTVWPGQTPVALITDRIVVEAHRNTVQPVNGSSA